MLSLIALFATIFTTRKRGCPGRRNRLPRMAAVYAVKAAMVAWMSLRWSRQARLTYMVRS